MLCLLLSILNTTYNAFYFCIDMYRFIKCHIRYMRIWLNSLTPGYTICKQNRGSQFRLEFLVYFHSLSHISVGHTFINIKHKTLIALNRHLSTVHEKHTRITVMSHECTCPSNHPNNCLSWQHLVQASKKETPKLRLTGPLWWRIHQAPVDSPHKGPVMRKSFPCHDVIISILDANGLPLSQHG